MDITWADYPALKEELNTDPKSLGYASLDNILAAQKLNQLGASNEKIDRDVIDGQDLMECVVISEYVALGVAQREAWTAIVSAGNGQVDIKNTSVRLQIGAIWGAGTVTRTNLIALQQRPASRAEILFGKDVIIHKWDVARSRALP